MRPMQRQRRGRHKEEEMRPPRLSLKSKQLAGARVQRNTAAERALRGTEAETAALQGTEAEALTMVPAGRDSSALTHLTWEVVVSMLRKTVAAKA